MTEMPTRRPVADRLEIAAPSLVALAARVAGQIPGPLRRRVLVRALARAEAAFNRGDFVAVFALFAENAHYVPPPVLSQTPIAGRDAILHFWRTIEARFTTSTIENLSLDEVEPERFSRTLRITHGTDGDKISYVIRQVTELRHGRVVSQVNHRVD
jgi:hypothetical protein